MGSDSGKIHVLAVPGCRLNIPRALSSMAFVMLCQRNSLSALKHPLILLIWCCVYLFLRSSVSSVWTYAYIYIICTHIIHLVSTHLLSYARLSTHLSPIYLSVNPLISCLFFLMATVVEPLA